MRRSVVIVRLQVETYLPKLLHHVDKIFQIQALISKANAFKACKLNAFQACKINALIFKANASKASKVKLSLKTGSVNDHQNANHRLDVTAR